MTKHFSIIILFLVTITAQAQYSSDITIEPLLKTDTTTLGQHIVYPSTDSAEIIMLRITIAPGKSTGWHKHQIPVFAYVVSGTLTVELENNQSKQFTANTTFAEVFDTYHNGTNKTQENVVLVAFFLGKKGEKLSIHK